MKKKLIEVNEAIERIVQQMIEYQKCDDTYKSMEQVLEDLLKDKYKLMGGNENGKSI